MEARSQGSISRKDLERIKIYCQRYPNSTTATAYIWAKSLFYLNYIEVA